MTDDSREAEEPRLDKRVFGGTLWMILVKFCDRGIGLVSTLILARLLVAEDFGLIAMTMSVVALVELLSAFSFDIILIQKQDAGREHFDTVWTLNILFSAIMALVLLLLATPASGFYQEPRLANLISLIAASVFLRGFTNIGTVMFRKDLDFRKEFNFMVLKKVIGFCVTIPLAFAFRNYWALIAGIIASSVGSVILSFLMHPYRPWFRLDALREIFSFSTWLFVNNLLFFARGRAADFVVGRLAGAHSLGVLTISYEISQLATSELVQPINRAVFPGYSKLNQSMKAIRQAYLDVYRAVALFAVPAGVGMAIVAPNLIPVALGEKWMDAIVPVQLLSAYGVLVAIQASSSMIYLAMGRPRILTALAAISVCITLPILILSTQKFGLIGACVGMLASVVLMAPFNIYAILRILDLRLLTLSRGLVRPVLASAAMAAPCMFLQSLFTPTELAGNLLLLLATVTLGAAVFTASGYTLWKIAGSPPGPELQALALLRSRLNKAGNSKDESD